LLPDAKQRSLAVHPTQLYSTINALVLLALLLAYEPFRRRDGELTALLFTLYPVTRFLLEQIRVDEPPLSTTGLSISQNISLLVLAAVACGWVWLLRQPAKLTWPGPLVPPPPQERPGEPG
jgi:phosphatidylglycerol:prolipoprotein diacylglycerol transferase